MDSVRRHLHLSTPPLDASSCLLRINKAAAAPPPEVLRPRPLCWKNTLGFTGPRRFEDTANLKASLIHQPGEITKCVKRSAQAGDGRWLRLQRDFQHLLSPLTRSRFVQVH